MYIKLSYLFIASNVATGLIVGLLINKIRVRQLKIANKKIRNLRDINSKKVRSTPNGLYNDSHVIDVDFRSINGK